MWTHAEALPYEDRRRILRRIESFLEELAAKGVLRRRVEVQSIGYGDEVGFDYVRERDSVVRRTGRQ